MTFDRSTNRLVLFTCCCDSSRLLNGLLVEEGDIQTLQACKQILNPSMCMAELEESGPVGISTLLYELHALLLQILNHIARVLGLG